LLPVLSHYQAEELLAGRAAHAASVTTSLDLGRTRAEIGLGVDGVHLPAGELLGWATIEKIAASENQCFSLDDGEARAIQIFSAVTNWARSLYPTSGAPTTLVAGFPMHRIKDTDPWEDTRTKVAALAPVTGSVLDTATGLGYTAIELTRTAAHVTTIELDPAALELAQLNPWSRELFDNPAITQFLGDAFELVPSFADDAFERILHDPPTFSLAGELYSEEFYRELCRVLVKGGLLFHYVGDPGSKFGKRMTTGVVRRLREAGFRRVSPRPEAFGVLATK
jgi:predicted methyltransferase